MRHVQPPLLLVVAIILSFGVIASRINAEPIEEELKFNVKHPINKAAISPDGKTLVAGGLRIVTTWDLAKGKRKTTLEGHKGYVNSVAFSADGGMVLVGANGPQVKLWRLSTGAEKFATTEHDGPVLAVAVCPNGKLMASTGGDRTIRLFDPSGKELAILKGHEKIVWDIAFMPSPPSTIKREGSDQEPRTYKRLASVSDDNTVKIWDVEKHKAVVTLKGHDNSVYCVAASPDGALLATGSADATIRLWDTSFEKEAVVLSGRRAGGLASLAFSPDSKLLAAADSGESGRPPAIRLWDIMTSKEIAFIPKADVRTVLFTPDGKRLIGCVRDQGTVHIWQVDKLLAAEK